MYDCERVQYQKCLTVYPLTLSFSAIIVPKPLKGQQSRLIMQRYQYINRQMNVILKGSP